MIYLLIGIGLIYCGHWVAGGFLCIVSFFLEYDAPEKPKKDP